MDLEYYGANCIKLNTKKQSFVVDDTLESVGLKPATKPGDVRLYTSTQNGASPDGFVIDSPGEYEVSNVSIQGISAKSFNAESNQESVIYKIATEDIRIVFAGSINSDLSDDELEAIGTVDVLFIPIGGGGVTLDGVNALKIIKKIEPKIVVPTYYAEKGVKYEAGLLDLTEALKEVGMEPAETLGKLKLKNLSFTDTTRLIVLERQ